MGEEERIKRLKTVKIPGQSTEPNLVEHGFLKKDEKPKRQYKRKKKKISKKLLTKEIENFDGSRYAKEISALSNPADKKAVLNTSVVLKPKKKIITFFLRAKLFCENLWQKIHHPIKQNWLTFIMIIALTVTVSVISSKVLFSPNTNNIEQFGLMAKLETLKQSHDYYTNMATKDEMLMSWVKMFSSWKYKTGGDPRYNTGDCVGAVHAFFKQWNSNITFEDINAMISRCKSLEDRGEIKRRLSIIDVHHGDLIIFDFGSSTPKHVGIVYDGVNGWVRYMDVNGATGTWGLERARFEDRSIKAIYCVSFSYWIGSLMKEINSK